MTTKDAIGDEIGDATIKVSVMTLIMMIMMMTMMVMLVMMLAGDAGDGSGDGMLRIYPLTRSHCHSYIPSFMHSVMSTADHQCEDSALGVTISQRALR